MGVGSTFHSLVNSFRDMNSGVDILVEAKNNSTSHQRATCTEPKPDAVEVSHFATVQYFGTSHFMYRPRFAGSG